MAPKIARIAPPTALLVQKTLLSALHVPLPVPRFCLESLLQETAKPLSLALVLLLPTAPLALALLLVAQTVVYVLPPEPSV